MACDLYNEHRRARNLEAFFVHMGIAWTNLLQAILERDGISYYYREKTGRYIRIGGEKKSWDCQRMVEHYLPGAGDPVRKNIEFFIGLRNKVEHRLSAKQQKALLEMVAGKCQAYLRNFEMVLTKEFSQSESLANELHLPLFLSSLTEEAIKAVKTVRAAIPKGIVSYIDEFDASVGLDVSTDQAYDFRVTLIPRVGGPSIKDTAIEFVDIKALDAEQLAALNKALVIIRDRTVEVANLERLKPSEVVRRVKECYPAFSMESHTLAWRHFRVRPVTSSTEKTRTEARYCVYDRAHNDYLYSEAWVKKLLKELSPDPAAAVSSWKAAPNSLAIAAGNPLSRA